MRSRAEEDAVTRELLHRHHQGKLTIHRAANMPDYLMKDFGHHPVDDGLATVAVCMLYRGKLRLPGNHLGGCADCYARLEMDPGAVRAGMTTLCAFCALRRLGDG